MPTRRIAPPPPPPLAAPVPTRPGAPSRPAAAASPLFPAGDAGESLSPAAAAMPDFSPESRRERHRRETFERLVRAAREIMFNRGFNDITVQDITEAADVGKGTFFNYFRSKEHIVTRVQEYNRRGLVGALERVRSGEQSPLAALTDVLTRLMCPTGGEWLTYQSNTMRALALHPEVREYFSPELRSNHQVYTQIMEVGQQQGKVRSDIAAADLATLTQTFLAGTTVVYWIHGIVPTPLLIADLVATFFKTLEADAAEVAPAHRSKRPVRAAGTRKSPSARRAREARKRPPTRRR